MLLVQCRLSRSDGPALMINIFESETWTRKVRELILQPHPTIFSLWYDLQLPILQIIRTISQIWGLMIPLVFLRDFCGVSSTTSYTTIDFLSVTINIMSPIKKFWPIECRESGIAMRCSLPRTAVTNFRSVTQVSQVALSYESHWYACIVSNWHLLRIVRAISMVVNV